MTTIEQLKLILERNYWKKSGRIKFAKAIDLVPDLTSLVAQPRHRVTNEFSRGYGVVIVGC